MTIDAGWLAAILTLVGMVCALFGWLVPSPRDKEKMAQALREDAMKMWTDRLIRIETDHRLLEREYIKSNAELRAAVQGLNTSVANLNGTIQALTRSIGKASGQ